MLEAAVVSGLVPGATEVDFFVDGRPLGTATPSMVDAFSQSTRAQISWEAVPEGYYELTARTRVQRAPEPRYSVVCAIGHGQPAALLVAAR